MTVRTSEIHSSQPDGPKGPAGRISTLYDLLCFLYILDAGLYWGSLLYCTKSLMFVERLLLFIAQRNPTAPPPAGRETGAVLRRVVSPVL